jgi:hypothetical protein
MFAEYGKGPNRLVELGAGGKMVWQHKFLRGQEGKWAHAFEVTRDK